MTNNTDSLCYVIYFFMFNRINCWDPSFNMVIYDLFIYDCYDAIQRTIQHDTVSHIYIYVICIFEHMMCMIFVCVMCIIWSWLPYDFSRVKSKIHCFFHRTSCTIMSYDPKLSLENVISHSTHYHFFIMGFWDITFWIIMTPHVTQAGTRF